MFFQSLNNRIAKQIIILGGGALRVSSAAFRQEVEAAQREIRELAGINNDKG